MRASFFKQTNWMYYFGLLAVVLPLGCQVDTQDEFPVQAHVYTRFLQDNGKVNSILTFTYQDSVAMGERDTTHYTAFINDNSYKKTISQIEGIKYVYAGTLPFIKEFKLNIKRPDGKELKQNMPFNSIDSLSQPITLSLSKSNAIHWHGSQLGEKEQLIVLVTTEKNQTISTTVSGPLTQNIVNITPDQLAGLEIGKATLYFVRSNEFVQKENQYEFNFKTEYFSKTYHIEVVP